MKDYFSRIESFKLRGGKVKKCRVNGAHDLPSKIEDLEGVYCYETTPTRIALAIGN